MTIHDAVTRAIPRHDRGGYLDAARAIEASGAQALWVQHEYGIYGGPAGEHLDRADRPASILVIATLYTAFETPNPDERRVTEALRVPRLTRRSHVMAEKGREIPGRVQRCR